MATGDGALLVGGSFFRSTPGRVLSLGGRTLTPLHYSDNFTARWETSGVVSRLARTPPLVAATLAGGHGVLVAQGATLRVEGADGRVRWQRALGASEGAPTGVVALGERGYVFTANNAGTGLRAFALRDGAPVLERAVAPGPCVPLGASRDLLWLAPAEHAVVGLDGRNPLPDALVLDALTPDGEPARHVRVSSSAFGFVDGALARPTALVDGSNGVVLGVDLWTRGWDEGALSAGLVRVDTNAAGPGAAPRHLPLRVRPRVAPQRAALPARSRRGSAHVHRLLSHRCLRPRDTARVRRASRRPRGCGVVIGAQPRRASARKITTTQTAWRSSIGYRPYGPNSGRTLENWVIFHACPTERTS